MFWPARQDSRTLVDGLIRATCFFTFLSMDLNPRVLNHGGAVHGIRNLLRYGIDCIAIVWNQAAYEYTYGDAIRLRRLHTR